FFSVWTKVGTRRRVSCMKALHGLKFRDLIPMRTFPIRNAASQAEYGDAGFRAHVDLAVRDRRRDELVIAELISRARLIAVVEFGREIARVVRMQHGRGRRVLDAPYDAVRVAVRGD